MEHNATFLGAGIQEELKHLTTRLEILDSHLFTAEYREQTRINAAVDFHL